MQSYKDNAQVILAIDAGGTFLKSALQRADESIVPLPEVATHSDGSADEIRNAFETVVRNGEELSEAALTGIAVATPGPFDFREGIFRMDHKYQSVKGHSIREFLPELPLVLLHDANAFLLGIPGMETGRVGGITLGTGLGAAAADHGVCINNDALTPKHPLWNIPFRGGIAEDYISTRALLNAFPGAKTVKEMAELPETEPIWQEFGRNLAELLLQWQKLLSLDKVYIGGGISKANNRFLVPELKQMPIEFYTGDSPALAGLFHEFRKKYANIPGKGK